MADADDIFPSTMSKRIRDAKNREDKAKGGIFGGIAASGGFNFGQPASTAGGLAEAIEKQAASQKRQAEAKSAAQMISPFDSLQSQLFDAINSIGVAPTPLEELQRMAQQQVAAQFDPQIRALKDEMERRTNRGESSMKSARDMYGSLSKDFLSELPAMTEQFAAEDAATNQRYDQAQSQMKGEYDKQAAEQDAVLRRLGVQAASQDASQQTDEDQSYFQNQMEADQQSSISALNEQQMAQQNYQQNLGSNAKMTGENTAQDIRGLLDDFLGQANSQLTGLEGQKGSAISALLSQMQQQDAARVQQQSQQEFQNQLALANFQLQAANSAAKYAPSDNSIGQQFGAEGTISTGLEGAQNYLASKYPDQPILASNLMEQLNDVLSSKEVTDGKFILDPGDPSMGKAPKYSDVGQEKMMDLLRREFEQENGRYQTGDINTTMNALLAYLGKLR